MHSLWYPLNAFTMVSAKCVDNSLQFNDIPKALTIVYVERIYESKRQMH